MIMSMISKKKPTTFSNGYVPSKITFPSSATLQVPYFYFGLITYSWDTEQSKHFVITSFGLQARKYVTTTKSI